MYEYYLDFVRATLLDAVRTDDFRRFRRVVVGAAVHLGLRGRLPIADVLELVQAQTQDQTHQTPGTQLTAEMCDAVAHGLWDTGDAYMVGTVVLALRRARIHLALHDVLLPIAATNRLWDARAKKDDGLDATTRVKTVHSLVCETVIE